MPDRETVPALFEPDSRRPSALAFVDSVHTVRLPLSALGRTVELSVAQIRGSQGGSEPLRTMYLTDANTSFSVTVSVASVLRMGGELAPLCIVGLGYDVGDVFNDAAAFERWHQQRVDDYLPAGAEVPGAPTMRGNAERFREALFDEIVPFVESNFPVSATDRIFAATPSGASLASSRSSPDPACSAPAPRSVPRFRSSRPAWAMSLLNCDKRTQTSTAACTCSPLATTSPASRKRLRALPPDSGRSPSLGSASPSGRSKASRISPAASPRSAGSCVRSRRPRRGLGLRNPLTPTIAHWLTRAVA